MKENISSKSHSKAIAKSSALILGNLLIAVIIGTILLILVYKLPTENIDKNVQKSATVLQREGAYPKMFSLCVSKLDNYTDSIMLLEAADDTVPPPTNSTINKAMMAYRGKIEDFNPCDTLVSHYVSGTDFTEKTTYSRYWHGYQIFLKPLLEFLDYNGIRILNLIVQISLTIFVCYLMTKRNMKQYIIPYILSYLMLMPIVLGYSMQYSSCFYAFTLGNIALLLMPNNIKHKYTFLIFLNIGIFTAYFDFLTYPIATFGVPAVMYLAIRNEDTVKNKLIDMIKNGISWCIGYGGMWVSKWIVTYLFTGYNTFAEASNAFAGRTSNTVSSELISKHLPKILYSFPRLSCELLNYGRFLLTPVTVLGLLFVIYLIYKIYKLKTVDTNKRYIIITLIPYIIISLAPVVWFLFATNHSTIHSMFTNKACVVTAMAVLFGFTDLLSRCRTFADGESFKKNNLLTS